MDERGKFCQFIRSVKGWMSTCTITALGITGVILYLGLICTSLLIETILLSSWYHRGLHLHLHMSKSEHWTESSRVSYLDGIR